MLCVRCKRNSSSRALAGILSDMADCMSIMSIFPEKRGGEPQIARRWARFGSLESLSFK